MLRSVFFVISIMIANLVLLSAAQAAQWKMPLANDARHFQTVLAVDFAKEVGTATDGRVSIKTFPSGKLFKGEQIFGAVRSGLVPIGSRLMSALERENLMLQLDSLPYLAKSFLDAFKLYKASKVQIDKILKVKGVKLLYAVPWPAQGMYSRIKLESVAELKGLKFRPYNAVTADFGKALGLVPVIVRADKLEKSLKRKQIDIMFGSTLAAYRYPLQRYFGYWYDIKAWRPKEMVVINLKQWQGLSGKDRSSMLRVAKNIESRGWMESKKVAEQSRQYLLNQGVVVGEFSAQMQSEIESIGLSLVQQWLQKVGDPGRYLLERYIRL